MSYAVDTEHTLFCGVEGGGTHSTCVFVDYGGTLVASAEGLSTNQYLVGMETCCERIRDLVSQCWDQVGYHGTIAVLSLCLSGINNPDNQVSLERMLRQKDSRLAKEYYIRSDSFGLFGFLPFSASEAIVCIAGTGSLGMGLQLDPASSGKDLIGYKSGGWGHLLGDEGSAYTIVVTALRMLIRWHERHGTIGVETESEAAFRDYMMVFMMQEWGITNLEQLLDIFYSSFSKDRIAKMCAGIANLARETGNEVAQSLFRQGGKDLSDAVLGAATLMKRGTATGFHAIPIFCVGSVWKSWDLIRDGFLANLEAHGFTPKDIHWVSGEESVAIGAAILGARFHGISESYFKSADFREHLTRLDASDSN